VNAIRLPPERMPFRYLCEARVPGYPELSLWCLCCSWSDEEEDAEAKAQRLTQRLQPAAAGSAPAATRSSAGAAAQQQAERAHPPQTEASAPPDDQQSTHAAQTPHGKVSSGRISLGGAIGAAQRNGGTALAPQTAAAAVPNVLSFVQKQQASVADRDWLFGGAGDGPGGHVDLPEQPAEMRSAAASRSQRARRVTGTAPSSSTEQRDFIRAKKFSGVDSVSARAGTSLSSMLVLRAIETVSNAAKPHVSCTWVCWLMAAVLMRMAAGAVQMAHARWDGLWQA